MNYLVYVIWIHVYVGITSSVMFEYMWYHIFHIFDFNREVEKKKESHKEKLEELRREAEQAVRTIDLPLFFIPIVPIVDEWSLLYSAIGYRCYSHSLVWSGPSHVTLTLELGI